MTIASNDRRKEYAGNGVTTVFTGPRAFSASHIAVYLVDDTTGVATLTTAYTLANVNVRNRSTTVTMTTAPATGTTLLILRTVPFEQQTNITNQGAYLPQVVEDALDALAQQAQQLEDRDARTIRLADSAVLPEGFSSELPSATPLAPLVWNADGTALENGSTLGTGDMLLRANLSAAAGSALVGFLQAGTGAVARTARDKLRDMVSVKDFGAKGDGVTNDRAAINAAINAVLAAGGGTVFFPGGTYQIENWLTMRNGVRLLGDGTAKIIQKAGANLGVMLEWGDFGVFANDVTVENLIIDGNRANNTDSDSVFLLHVRGGTGATIKGCQIINSPGFHMASNGVRTSVLRNRFDNCFAGSGIITFSPTPVDAYPVVDGNTFTRMGGGSILIGFADHALFCNNNIIGTVIGGRGNRLTINTSGTTVTWASGPQFDTILPGMFVVVNNGMEFRVLSKVSNTQLTVSAAMPTLTGAQASIGTGDLAGSFASSHGRFIGNTIYGGVTYGLGLSQGGSAHQCSHNVYANNTLILSGKNGISVHYDTGTGYMEFNSFIGNKLYLPCNSGGIASADRKGIYIQSAAANKILSTQVVGNSVFSTAGDGQVEHWMAFGGSVAAGSALVGQNMKKGTASSGISGEVISVVLSAGWGTTATVDQITSHGNSLTFRVNSAGTGQAAFPSLTVNKACGSLESVPLVLSKMVTSSGGVIGTLGESASVNGAWSLTLGGTPTAGQSYIFTMLEVS